MRQDNRLKGFGEDSVRIRVDKSGSGHFLIVTRQNRRSQRPRRRQIFFRFQSSEVLYRLYTFYLRDYDGRRRQQEDLRYRIVNRSPPLPSRHHQTHLLVIA